ncbi:tetratricopeptide repeat protein [Candidatus Leptofilum sp.]|uniref:tetratricopeptide repeat protein n=1 Tax=Candidatus Leptofilum sp. TaxID=3241576 RepID=UPI003B5B124C
MNNINDLIRAEKHFRSAENINSQNRSLLRWLGFTLAALGHENDALNAWKSSSIQMYEELVFIGSQKRTSNQFQEALLWYDRAIHLYPSIADPWYYKGLTYEKLSLYDISISSFWTGLHQPRLLNIGKSNYYFRLGWTHSQKQGEPEWIEILNFYDKAISIDSFSDNWTLMQTHFAKGEILMRLNREPEAIEEFKFVVENDPTHYASRVQLGSLVWSLNKDAELAEQLYWEAIDINPGSKWGYRGLAILLQDTQKPDLAIQMYETVLMLDPQDVFASTQLTRLQQQ